jgi:hypothetical protein
MAATDPFAEFKNPSPHYKFETTPSGARESGGGRTRLRRSLGLVNRLSCAPSDFGALSENASALFALEPKCTSILPS